MRTKYLVVSSLMLLSACAATVDKNTIATANYGDYPKNYQHILEARLKDDLVDPYSAVFRFPEKPYRGYLRAAPVNGGAPTVFGYVVKTCVNARNRFGGYVGESCRNYLIRNGQEVYPITANQFFDEPWFR